MKLLIVGSGAREHALAWALSASPLVDRIIAAPGNPGIAAHAELIDVAAEDIDGLVTVALEQRADLVVVGPETPLALGLVDRLVEAGVRAFGPKAAAARLESSKDFAKRFCRDHRIPTAGFASFTTAAPAKAYVRERGAPIVVKADGLAAGKGVVVATSVDEAEAAIDSMLDGVFGAAGSRVVIEDFLEGEEASLFALCDGTNALLIGTAQDHKRIGEGDTGANTGGMGAYSPPPVLTGALIDRTMDEIVRPTLAGMAARATPFTGFLYCGLMITSEGPMLIEYNVRFGDPECQVVLPRLETDLAELLVAALEGDLGQMQVRSRDQACVGVVLANQGYPSAYQSGSTVTGLDRTEGVEGVHIFHAGTRRVDGELVAAGGRVLTVVALAETMQAAVEKVYRAVETIGWSGRYYRRDIAWRAL
ncbi:MAG: phosphoribosylamine--glycine ligase [Geminicoccaceae bacterium]